MVQMPDMSACESGGSCRSTPVRDLRTGLCPDPVPIADGMRCSPGIACEHNNVCNQGVCGGQSVPICLREDGVVDNGNGQYVAVFGYASLTSEPARPTPNVEQLNGTTVANPHPAPPTVFQPDTHLGASFQLSAVPKSFPGVSAAKW